jgi:hypothetical protein
MNIFEFFICDSTGKARKNIRGNRITIKRYGIDLDDAVSKLPRGVYWDCYEEFESVGY